MYLANRLNDIAWRHLALVLIILLPACTSQTDITTTSQDTTPVSNPATTSISSDRTANTVRPLTTTSPSSNGTCSDIELPLVIDDSLLVVGEFWIVNPGTDYPDVVGPDWWQLEEACRYVWELENVVRDESEALDHFEAAAKTAGFECQWFDHDALQTLQCTRGEEALLVQNIGFVIAHVLWERP